MNIAEIELYVIQMPLKSPFVTHLEAVNDRKGIIVKVTCKDGVSGFGEGVAFSTPWYTEETVTTSLHMLKDILIPLLQKHPIKHPEEASKLFSSIRRNNMAKAALETALWDLYAKSQTKPLSKILNGTRPAIASGVVVATDSTVKAIQQIEQYLEQGYQRIKVKINPNQDYAFLAEIRRHYPDLPIMADANSSYSLQDIDRLKALDDLNLMMIEQPLAHDDIIEHAQLQKEIRTPICLDESIVTFEDARKAIEFGSCKVINIKVGRVGGLYEAKRIHDYCFEKGIPVWCGGMIEFGISRVHNIALASLPGFSIPGDISASSRFWEEDIITPEVTVENGFITVPESPGIGYEINENRLQEVLLAKKTFTFPK
ncbi:o-succinylbenzoic acid (OSB) synthetase [Neobacillus bataviensis LMG 21833]|uniref:o-succinylbenzoate synthase n=1 Tax=Neobacillus bataviensis LMG 21833 TaxID=1117379 RepID=K6DCE4_9BACI|nr:o-succinylbenzoate synthase [Neobacillus bataviensis]EKN65964.1 o-succinylbenzoic acid (OSB) synthetase [Neobacillus bataviensis LMG 21833]